MPPNLADLEVVFSSVLGVALTLVGISTLAMLLVGGFQFMSAGGDKEAAQKAQRTLTYAIAGLVLTLSAWVIMNLIGSFLGINVSGFSICLPGSIRNIVGQGGCTF